MYFFIFTLIFEVSAVQFYATNDNPNCDFANFVCDGNITSPFKTFLKALKAIDDYKEAIENDGSLQIYLESSGGFFNHLITEQGVSDSLLYFSPFKNLNEQVKITITNWEQGSKIGPAIISLRTEKLKFEVSGDFEISNILIEGRDLQASQSKMSCLESNIGCCSSDDSFYSRKTPCRLYKRAYLGLDYTSLFRFYRGSGYQGQETKIKFSSFALLNFNPVFRYSSLGSLETEKSYKFVFENSSLSTFTFLKGLFSFEKFQQGSPASNYMASYLITNLTTTKVNIYFIAGNVIQALFDLETLTDSKIGNMSLNAVEFEGSIILAKNFVNLALENFVIVNSKSLLFDINSGSNVNIKNIEVLGIVVNSFTSVNYFISIGNCQYVVLDTLNFRKMNIISLVAPLYVVKTLKAFLRNFVFEDIHVRNVGFLYIEDLDKIEISLLRFSGVSSNIQGLMQFWGFINNFTCYSTFFEHIVGGKGAILSSTKFSRTKFISISNGHFFDIECRISSCLELQTQTNLLVLLNNTDFEKISGSSYLFQITSIYKFFKGNIIVSNISLKEASISIFKIQWYGLKIKINILEVLNTISQNPLLLDDLNSEEITISNGIFKNCTAEFYFLYSIRKWEITVPFIRKLLFLNISAVQLKKSSIFWVANQQVSFLNCRFNDLQTAVGFGMFTLQYINLLVEFTVFENMKMPLCILAYIFYDNYDFYFKNSIFRDIDIPSIGALVAVSKSSRLYIYDCMHYRFRGKYVPIYMGIIDSYIEIKNSSFWDIQIENRGMIIFVSRRSTAFIKNSKFINIKGGYSGPIANMEHEAQLTFQNCSFVNVSGNKGGVFQIFKNTTLIVSNSLFLHCTARLEGGIINTNDFFKIDITNSLFAHITAYTSGGAFYLAPYSSKKKREIKIINCEFRNLLALLDGALAYISNIMTVLIQNISVNGTSSMNSGCFHLKSIENIMINGLGAIYTHADEKAGVIFFEKIQQGVLMNFEFRSASSFAKGVVIYSANSHLEISSGLIINCSAITAEAFINIYNSEVNISKISLANINVTENEGSTSFFLFYNELVENSYLEVNLSAINFNKNSISYIIDASKSKINISSLLFKELKIFEQRSSTFFKLYLSQFKISYFHGVDSDIDKVFYADSMRNLTMENFLFSNVKVKLYVFCLNSNYVYLRNFTYRFQYLLLETTEFFVINETTNIQLYSLTLNLTLSKGITKIANKLGSNTIFHIRGTNTEIYNLTLVEFYSEADKFIDISSEKKNFSLKDFKSFNASLDKSRFFITLDSSSILVFQNIKATFFEFSNTQKLIFEFHQLRAYLSNKAILISDLDFLYCDCLFLFRNIYLMINIHNLNITKRISNFPALSIEDCFAFQGTNIFLNKITNTTAMEFTKTPTNILNSGKIIIENSGFINCFSNFNGGVVRLEGSINAIFRNSNFESNFALKTGGAIYFRNFYESEGSFEITKCKFLNNSAGKQPGVIRLNTNNKQIVDSFKEILLNNSFDDGDFKNQAELNENVSYWPTRYQFKIKRAGDPNWILFDKSEKLYDGDGLESLSIYSGEKIMIEVEFFDNYMQKVFDYDSKTFSCASNIENSLNYSLTFEYNKVKIYKNKAIIQRMQISSDKSVFETNFFCKVDGAVEETDLNSLMVTAPIKFYMKTCQIGQILREKKCVLCTDKSYSFELNITSRTYCYPCPDHATCSNGTVISPKVGYWNFNSSSIKLIRCQVASSCPGAENGVCSAGYYGNLCFDCENSYGKLPDFTCDSCSSGKGVVIILFKVLANFLTLLLILSLSFFQKNHDKLGNQLPFLHNFIDYFECFTLIFSLNFFDVEVFKAFHIFISIFSFFGNFNFLHDCIFFSRDEPEVQFILNYLTNLVIPIIFSFLICFLFLGLKKKGVSQLALRSNSALILKITTVSLYSYWMNIVRNTAVAYFCTNMYHNKQLSYTNQNYMVDFPNIKCDTDYHNNVIIPLVTVIMSLYILVILICEFTISRKYKKEYNYFKKSNGKISKTKCGMEILRFGLKLALILNFLESRVNVMTFQVTTTLILIPIFAYSAMIKNISPRLLLSVLINYITIYITAVLLKNIDSSEDSLLSSLPIGLNLAAISINIFLFILSWGKMRLNNK